MPKTNALGQKPYTNHLGAQSPVKDCNNPTAEPTPVPVFLKKLSQNIAIDQEGMIYGNTNTVDKNFLNGIFVLVIRNANVPPIKMEIKQANSAINIDFPNGVQNKC